MNKIYAIIFVLSNNVSANLIQRRIKYIGKGEQTSD